ncbi:phospholipase D family protein [Vibrio comitans]|uniref:Phospholipase D family protein n=1 Tax=Vibrio comitans NBRC 102076 TaxID=1219078 RepID=A0A4Y3IJZ5_9VIBR|nr:phospholipase D family protein [Vibrio comitans]GEA59268.1 phospholipase D family protein [Vibrio comitans NBRC 102076]
MPTLAHWKLILILFVGILSGCATQQTPPPKSVTHHLGYQSDSRLAEYFDQSEYDTSVYTGFYPLDTGHDALLARIVLIESAKHTLDLQYYIYRDDETGHLMTWRLFEAAERGVRVRVLLDDMQKRSDDDLAYLNSHPNIDVRLFNPNNYRSARNLGFLADFERLNSRMHNKSLTADNVVSIVGGRNIGNEYFSYYSPVEFGDFDLLLYGNTVEQTSDQFDEYWNSDFAVPIDWITSSAKELKREEIEQFAVDKELEKQFTSGAYDMTQLQFYSKMQDHKLKLYWGTGRLLYDKPNKIIGEGSQLIDDLKLVLEGVESELIIISPYFVPTEVGTKLLVDGVKSGKKVTIITNSLASNDVYAVHGWYSKYRKDLIEGGVELWEMRASAKIRSKWSMTGSGHSSLHAKIMLIDDDILFVGSMNWDPRSAHINTEMAVMLEHEPFVTESKSEMRLQLIESAYKLELEDGDLVWRNLDNGETYTSEPDASLWRRMGAWMAGVLPIEDQL